MDITDKKILKILSKNANTTATEISEAVNLSIPAVNKRIQKLQNDKIIRSFTVITDGEKVKKPVIAFVFIVFRYDGTDADELLKHIIQDTDVLECYAVTGEYDYIVKICAEDIMSLESKILRIKRQKGVVKSHTMISLMEHKFQPTILPDLHKDL